LYTHTQTDKQKPAKTLTSLAEVIMHTIRYTAPDPCHKQHLSNSLQRKHFVQNMNQTRLNNKCANNASLTHHLVTGEKNNS